MQKLKSLSILLALLVGISANYISLVWLFGESPAIAQYSPPRGATGAKGNTGATGAAGPTGNGPSTFTNATASRAVATVYHNITSNAMWVNITLTSGANLVYIYCDSSSSPTTIVSVFYNTSAASNAHYTMSFIVLPGYYYELLGVAGFNNWFEWK